VLTEYLPIVAMAVLAVLFGVASLVVSRAFRPHRPNPVKLSAYECGNDPVRLPRGERFSVKFYVVAMLDPQPFRSRPAGRPAGTRNFRRGRPHDRARP
jgi:hypothetical protein